MWSHFYYIGIHQGIIRSVKAVCVSFCFQVVILSIHSTYIPTKLCVLLDDAKELAAWTALWNLGTVKIYKHCFTFCMSV